MAVLSPASSAFSRRPALCSGFFIRQSGYHAAFTRASLAIAPSISPSFYAGFTISMAFKLSP